MQLKEIMTPNVEAVSRETSITEAARRMAAHDIGFLVVIDDGGPVGVLTDRDIVLRVVAEGEDPAAVTAEAVMTPHVELLDETSDVEEAARLMRDHQIRRLLVRGDHNRIVGVVSLGDLAVDADDDELSGETLQEISQPAHPR
jgi:CBS domain-containing protein